MRPLLPAVLVLIALLPCAAGQVCSHPRDPAFYETNGYAIRKIDFKSPFDFFFLVRQRFNLIKSRLPVKEGDHFEDDAYDRSFMIVRDAVKADSALGRDSPVKIAAVTGGLENCQEELAGPHTVDIVYRIFSTDPIPAIQATPEQREKVVDGPATTAAEQTSIPYYRVVPSFSYDRTRGAFGGLDLSVRIPTAFLKSLQLSASGSHSSRDFYGGFYGSGSPSRNALDHLEYDLAYAFNDTPALNVRLTKSIVNGHFIGSSKPLNTIAARVLFRYGAAFEQGIQQTNLSGQSSRYGALQLYGGLTSTTRYSETAVTYGLSVGGPGISNLGYARHIGDVTYGRRFPGSTNLPWDIALRATAGAITGGGTVLVNDRFFGGNAVTPLIPGAAWTIPSGPLVRSIPLNRLAGTGLGGTSFYSANFTIGKVIKGWSLIPPEVENSVGFDDAVNFAENTAQTWFADDYESASPEFRKLLTDYPPRLRSDVDAAKAVLASIRAAGPVSAAVSARLKKADSDVTISKILIETASDKTLRGPDRAERLRGWLTPASALVKLTKVLGELKPLVPSAAPRLDSVKESIEMDLTSLDSGLRQIQTGPAHDAASARARQDMARPREVIDTLRHETNRYSFSLVGIADAGRLWPDPYGTRYAFGGGGRVSLVNVNFTLGYAVNPSPRREIGQGRGALFLSITYTNLSR